MIWFLVPPSRSIRPALRPVRFSSYRIADSMFRFSVAHLPHSLRSSPFVISWWRGRFPFVSFLFSSCPSRGASRGYSLRLVSRPISLINSPASRQAIRSRFARASRSSARRASRPAVRFPVLFIVPRCFALPGSSFPVSSLVLPGRLVKQSVFSRFSCRLVLAVRGVG